MITVDRNKLKKLQERESQRFVSEHPRSAELYRRAQNSLLGGVPMNWMKKWAGAFPVFVTKAKGAHFQCVDGHDYVDLCLGDTGAMTGHSPDVVADAVTRRAFEGITLMLPTEDSAWVAGDCKGHVVRGGSWEDSATELRSAARTGGAKDDRFYTDGVRIARSL